MIEAENKSRGMPNCAKSHQNFLVLKENFWIFLKNCISGSWEMELVVQMHMCIICKQNTADNFNYFVRLWA